MVMSRVELAIGSVYASSELDPKSVVYDSDRRDIPEDLNLPCMECGVGFT